MALAKNPTSRELIDEVTRLEEAKQDTLPNASAAGKVLKSTDTQGGVEWGDASSGGSATNVKVDGTSITSNNEADLLTINGDYNASTNKLATANDLPDISTKMDKANPTGTGSLSLNRQSNTTVGTNSVAVGGYTTASGDYSHAEGYGPRATGFASHAEGSGNAEASGNSSHAEGAYTLASGDYSHAENCATTASGQFAHAEGYYTTAQRKSQHTFGEYNVLDTTGTTTTHGTYIEIVGNGTANNARSNARTLDWSGNEWLAGKITPSGGISDGNNANYVLQLPDTTNWTADKIIATTDQINTIAEIAEGKTANYVISDATTGTNVVNSSFNSTQDTVAITITSNKITDVQGNNINLSDLKIGDIVSVIETSVPDRWVGSIANSTITFYKLETKLDIDTNPTSGSTNAVSSGGVYSALSDKMDKANPTGTGSLSLNRKTNTTIGNYSVAEGYNTTASGSYSHAEGYNTIASNSYAHAEGSNTTAYGNSSHAEGEITTAGGSYSHAEGYSTVATGAYSHAEGNGTAAQRKSQHTFGEYNVLDTAGTTNVTRGNYVEIVGNGTSTSARSNARTLDWNGNEVLSGTSTATKFIGGLEYLTTAPTAANTNGIKIVVLSSEPTTRYSGYIYFITE